MNLRSIGILFAVVALSPDMAFAHATDGGHVLLLPTRLYLVGGAMAVALSFLVLALVPPRPAEAFFSWRGSLPSIPTSLRIWGSAVSFAVLVILVAAGFIGSRDPLSNPLPLTVWTLFWVGLTLVQGLFGNLWWWINPWYAPWLLAKRLGLARDTAGAGEPAFGYWPAVLLFFAFAWFELVYPAPDDPDRLALAVTAYWLLNFAAACVFGFGRWTERGECFSVFLGMIAKLGVVEKRLEDRRCRLFLRPPGAKLIEARALPLGGTLFLLLALSTVSFDGLMRTFFWLGLNGVNPLDYSGRSALIGISSYGLVVTFALLATIFLLAVAVGMRLVGDHRNLPAVAGRLVWSIIPISMAYHFSHYLTVLAVNGQYAVVSYSDPFALGWNLFGTADWHVQAGMVAGASSAWVIWNLQAGAIIAGHLLAVLVAHVIAFGLYHSNRDATRSQAMLALLMVGYTVFGLWLLSSPTAG